MTKREFTAVYQKRGSRYIAWVEEVPGANTQGKTKREAKENLEEALVLILESNRKILSGSRRRTIFREPIHVALPAR
ncbi:hypothetical protein A2833_00585 [Candidatus Azambacteria bacterium RIFCSPHIGHO2_01_FULL_44_55]|uniref:HicB family protein n=1 Tax=Candidatus Azambacteria bacterium RIFCSPLOWO2_02_FULL_44_14 TaxID=1797306 RepID=A0A1F5CBL6_9BACT|nr:MAG: hypothetical protein A3A18_02125 [Candidatus Azambacteria bacterium RIFCSPLOWO2_01_FULL_44_84]OGD33072.1 MAG: hypothetical protein A3C78_01520 [Candidatus Azambacteria bacterium RIFCSPHIGHO2_02_FULL_45_18]OGD40225.1 MAG: hypothetical protein A3I30_02575 [Candidatus Azambacteria bacterium RIFCSPLOWO2_02_FULL_44_14]OGD40890.1 MAG: hypothetical protein A2833_00585 [Candidatus Azambacteria bacterium RIFCSPHIGHO2_01_FULL_44_55]OGD50514.1 MAG: hypothetical protein A2608_01995 [Candidatus Azam